MKNHLLLFKVMVLVSVPLVMSACATAAKNTLNYELPEQIVVDNELTVAKPFEDVWSDLVRQLAKGFFVVNNIEKESRLINVSFSTNNPEDYIDCGESYRTFTQGKNTENISYKVAEDSKYKYGEGLDSTGVNAIISHYERNSSLEGRINIYVAPNEEETDVTVNVRYVFTIHVGGQITAVDVMGKIVQSQAMQVTQASNIGFNTNQPNMDDEGISCVSKGLLEEEILNMASSS